MCLFLVLPFHEGRTLRDALVLGPLDTTFVALLLREIGDAVSYSHAFYRLRRDLGTGIGKLLARALAHNPARRPVPVTVFTAELADAGGACDGFAVRPALGSATLPAVDARGRNDGACGSGRRRMVAPELADPAKPGEKHRIAVTPPPGKSRPPH